jgi:hypothetical protein
MSIAKRTPAGTEGVAIGAATETHATSSHNLTLSERSRGGRSRGLAVEKHQDGAPVPCVWWSHFAESGSARRVNSYSRDCRAFVIAEVSDRLGPRRMPRWLSSASQV